MALPKSSKVAFSKLSPTSSEITWPPVKIAISCNMAFLRSPKPGALTPATLTMPLMLLTTNVAKASPSMSSAITNKGLPDLATPSSSGNKSLMLDIFLSNKSMNGSSNSTLWLSAWLIKYGDKNPRSNCIPSTTSNSLSNPCPSSTVITPSLPTFCIASAMISPTERSELAEIVPT